MEQRATKTWQTDGPGGQKLIYTHSGGCCNIVSKITDKATNTKTFECCGLPMYQPAVDVGLMGCMATCKKHLEEYFEKNGTNLTDAIKNKSCHNAMIARGELICDTCGGDGAIPVPGEGQNLCSKCNYRTGINRWS